MSERIKKTKRSDITGKKKKYNKYLPTSKYNENLILSPPSTPLACEKGKSFGLPSIEPPYITQENPRLEAETNRIKWNFHADSIPAITQCMLTNVSSNQHFMSKPLKILLWQITELYRNSH